MNSPTLELLQQTLRREMPITDAMGIDVVSWENACLTMRMPLEPNRNHQYSAFAGSLNALCTIVGWGTIFMLLQRESLGGNIVIRRGKIRYVRPVRTPEFLASGLSIDPTEQDYFFELLRSKGKSKLDIGVEISDELGPYVNFQGSYVVQG
ncbi:MAG: YiiD C-terminal domain-containing protein [Planctomycetota bacterium]